MKQRMSVLALALVFLVPGLGGAAETVSASAPYSEDIQDIEGCNAILVESCSADGDADFATGSLTMDLAVESRAGGAQPGAGTAFAQPEIIGELPMSAASKIVVTATFHINSATAFREGTFSSATDGRASNAYAVAWMNARQLAGDRSDHCDELHGCIEPGSCLLCDSSSGQTVIVDVAAGPGQRSDADVIVRFELSHPTGSFSAGTLLFFGGLYGEASLESGAVPDDGSAGVFVDAVLTRVVAEFS